MKKLNKVNYNRNESVDAFATCSRGDCYKSSACPCGSGIAYWLLFSGTYSGVADAYFWNPKALHTK